MTRAALLLFAGLALASCREQPEPSPAGEPSTVAPSAAAASSVPAGTPLTEVGHLLGEYRVAGIDGGPLEAPIGIAVSIDGPMLSFEPTCAGFVWSLAFEAGRLATSRRSQVAAQQGAAPPPVCAVAVHPEQRRLAEALDAVDSATRTPDNGIVLAGGGRSVTLFSQ